MNPIAAEWVDKAEGDFNTGQRELAVQTSPNYDAVCFHAHQCAEKCLKARLIEAQVHFPKTHDLVAVLDLVLAIEPEWETLRERLQPLTRLAVEVRYTGFTADADAARQAMDTAEHVRAVVRRSLGLRSCGDCQ